VKARTLDTGDEYEHHFYKGINEDQANEFHNEFNTVKSQIRTNNMLGSNNRISNGSNNINRQNQNNLALPQGQNYESRRQPVTKTKEKQRIVMKK
jgi:hypothetical protein